jgi:hypothetical protein
MKSGTFTKAGEIVAGIARGTGLPQRAAENEPAPEPAPYVPIDASIAVNDGPTLSTELLAEARRAGLDLNTLAPDELDAFASGGVAGLTRYRQGLWNDEASKRPAQPNMMA